METSARFLSQARRRKEPCGSQADISRIGQTGIEFLATIRIGRLERC
jgi:hypothetical protein